MATAASCPSNATDCLLRAILDAQGDNEWDIPTFGATVAVGVLALLISITTVFQAILGAGPGRLKASKRAIGPFYSQRTRTKFSWTEVRFRTIAWCPLIDQVQWANKPEPPAAIQHKSHSVLNKPTNSIYGASWLNLIEPLPMNRRQWFVTPCQTDYLPADVLAAPARGSVRAIVELAALAGCDSVQTDGNYPLITGHGTQLSFRGHPSLGPVAVFDQVPLDVPSQVQPLQKRDILYLRGQMSFQGVFVEALAFDGKAGSKSSAQSISVVEALDVRLTHESSPQDLGKVDGWLYPGGYLSLILGLLTWDSLSNCRGLPFATLSMRAGSSELLRVYPIWRSLNKPMILHSIFRLTSAQLGNLAYDTSVPYGRGVTDEQRSTMLGWSWLHDHQVKPYYPDTRIPSIRLSEGKCPWYVWDSKGIVTKGTFQLTSCDGNLLILPIAMDLCIAWVENESAFTSIPPEEKDEARSALQDQLHEVDFWLLHHGGARSAQCVFQLLRLVIADPRLTGNHHSHWSGERKSFSPKALLAASKGISGPAAREPIKLPFEHLTAQETGDQDITQPYEVLEPDSTTSSPLGPEPLRLLPPPDYPPKKQPPPAKGIPERARWTKIARRLVNPEALQIMGLPFARFPDSVVVFKVLRRDEVAELADITYEIRNHRREREREHGGSKASISEASTGSEDDGPVTPSSYKSDERRLVSAFSQGVTPAGHEEQNKRGAMVEGKAAKDSKEESRVAHPTHSAHFEDSVDQDITKTSDQYIDPSWTAREARDAQADEGMMTLLVYRAILFAALGALAADTSCVFGTELGRRMVQVL